MICKKEIDYVCSKIREKYSSKPDLWAVKEAYRNGRLDLLLRDVGDLNSDSK